MAKHLPSEYDSARATDVLAYRVNSFCRAVGIGRTSFYRMLKDGEIKTVIIAGRRLIPAFEAERLLSGSSKLEKAAA
jgi:hypothetical protein